MKQEHDMTAVELTDEEHEIIKAMRRVQKQDGLPAVDGDYFAPLPAAKSAFDSSAIDTEQPSAESNYGWALDNSIQDALGCYADADDARDYMRLLQQIRRYVDTR